MNVFATIEVQCEWDLGPHVIDQTHQAYQTVKTLQSK